jgi:hypothetical protein
LHSIAATEIGGEVVRTREAGFAVGTVVGSSEGAMVGPAVSAIGAVVGLADGTLVGSSDGAMVGSAVI